LSKNRRNYYRILYVQPEAPAAVIKASYRTLMATLRQHPDLGGDHAQAALLNEAWAVLGDPDRRRAYDLARLPAWRRARRGAADGPAAAEHDPGMEVLEAVCPFCRLPLPAVVLVDTRCACGAPLATPPLAGADRGEPQGRRIAPRMAREDRALAYVQPQATAQPVRMRDLSAAGVGFVIATPIAVGRTIRIVAPGFDVVATVVSCRPHSRLHAVHARILTALYTATRGVFVSTRA
jgi:hypothetical protein